jgi:hypothetical protein
MKQTNYFFFAVVIADDCRLPQEKANVHLGNDMFRQTWQDIFKTQATAK